MANKLFYGWRIAGAGSALQFLQSMLLNSSFGVYVAVLADEKGWSKTALAGAAALKSTEVAVLGPVLGWMVDRFGSQGLVRAGVIIFGVGLMLLSQISSIAGFYGAFIVIALGSSMFSNFLVSIALIQWFEKRRTRALSMLQFGGALGGLFVFVVAAAIQLVGWRWTAFGSGVLSIIVGYPLARVIRSKPEDHGLTMDGLPPAPKTETAAAAQRNTASTPPAAQRAFTGREAVRTRAFWYLSIGHATSLLVVMAVNVHVITHMKEALGYSLAQASLLFALVTAGQIGGVMMGWVVGEKYVKRKVAAACNLMHALGLLLVTFATSAWLLAAALLLHGFGWGLRGPFMQAIRADYFGRTSIGLILGLSTLITVFGNIGGPLIAGAFADGFGDYRAGFTLLTLLAVIGAWFFYIAKPPRLPATRAA
ncbi:MAG: MFS transporter [Betaproteobacteria bacterium]|nr:MFS transporter [Betaproteobacteria bacterium]